MAGDLRLTVAASTIDGKGIAKLDSDSFRKLKLEDGVPVLVTYGTKTLDMKAALDSIFSESTVRLMKTDMAALRVEEGMEATVVKKNGPASGKKTAAKSRKGKRAKKANAASLDSF